MPSASKFDARAFRDFKQSIDYRHPGVFELAYVGILDLERWALVEKVTAMVYKPESAMLPSHDPKNALANALSLGRSVGRILADVAADGTVLAWIRPELIWADRVDGVLVATGLSARAQAFFSRATIDAVSLPIFDRFYFAPEAHDTDVDDRALTFALAIMIAEWAMGRFPFKRKWYDFVHEGRHLSLKPMLKPLAALLSRGMRPPRRDERPPLVRFLAELERL